MNELLIMVLSCFVVYHSVARMAKLPSINQSNWRGKVLAFSAICEVAGAFTAFGCAHTGASYYVPLVLLMASAATAPFVERRKEPRGAL